VADVMITNGEQIGGYDANNQPMIVEVDERRIPCSGGQC
jgi:hypothetical protein